MLIEQTRVRCFDVLIPAARRYQRRHPLRQDLYLSLQVLKKGCHSYIGIPEVGFG